MSIFQTIFQLSFFHQYFYRTSFEKFGFALSKASKKLMDNHDIIVRRNNNQIAILRDTDIKIEKQLSTGHILFYITSNDPYFINYTDTEFIKGNVFLFTNTSGSNSLHKQEKVGIDDQYPVQPSLFDFTHSKVSKGTDVSVFNSDNELLYSIKTETNTARINLSLEIAGVYSIFVNKEKLYSFLYLENTPLEGLLGVIDINLSQLNASDVVIPNHSISFAARKTFWKYFLSLSSSYKIDGLGIIDDAKKIEFEKDQEIRIINGNSYHSFISNQALQLQEKTDFGFLLKYSQDSGDKILIKHLPVPSVDLIKPQPDMRNFFSEIYVHL